MMATLMENSDQRKMTKQALRDQASLITAMVDAFNGIIYSCDRDYRIEFMNKGFRDRLGKDVTGQRCHEALHGLPTPCDGCCIERVFAGETVTKEVNSPLDGKWFLNVSNPIFGADGRVELKHTVMFDVTEHKEAERAYRDSTKSYLTLAQNLPGIVYRVFLREQGRTLFFNDMLERLTGFCPPMLAGGRICHIDPLIVSEDHDRVLSAVRKAIDQHRPFEVEYRMSTRDRGPIHVLDRGQPLYGDDGTPLYIDGVILDISERKNREDRLRQGERRFRSLAENSLVGISIVRNGCVIYQNDECSGLFGRDAQPGRPFDMERIHPEDGAAFTALYDRLMTGESHRIEAEIRLQSTAGRNRNDETSWVRILGSRIRFGEEEAILFNVMDITHAKRLEQIVRIKDKMSSLGRISAGIAHEIRNPLGGINMYLGVLKTVIEPMAEADDAHRASALAVVDKIQAASNRIEAVIRRVMDFAKPTALQLDSINLNDAVENALALAATSLRKSAITVGRHLDTDLPSCFADRAMMEQVLLNMINNSAQAMESSENERRLELVSKQVPGAVVIDIGDSGPGIAEDLLERIFDPFVTTKADGSGIGLSICHRIVADHNGAISVSRSRWGGALFSIRIPLEKRINQR